MRLRSLTSAVGQLAIHGLAFAIAGYALAQIVRGGSVVNFAIWFAGAAVVHDLVLLPAYSLLDRLTGHRRTRRLRRGPLVNYVRVPALISGLLLLLYFPLILGLSADNYFAATGHHLHGYLGHWLAITGVLFAASALLYMIRFLRAEA
jgi:ABC-type glycerol-3-phosphate transport system permease component